MATAIFGALQRFDCARSAGLKEEHSRKVTVGLAMFDTPACNTVLTELIAHLQDAQYSFTTVTPATHARVMARSDEGETLRDAFGWSRWCTRPLLPAELFHQLRDHGLLEGEPRRWRSRIRVSSLDGLLIAHSAYPTVDAASVFFGPDTYRFLNAIRRWSSANTAPGRVADIGCGPGTAGLWLARHWPQAEVHLADINEQALAIASANAQAAGIQNVSAQFSDILAGLRGSFDLIVANPPYMADPLKRSYRDGGGAHGCDLSVRIIAESMERLTAGGTLLLYTGTPVQDGRNLLLEDAAHVLDAFPGSWTLEELDPDVFGEELETDAYGYADRIAVVLLICRKSHG